MPVAFDVDVTKQRDHKEFPSDQAARNDGAAARRARNLAATTLVAAKAHPGRGPTRPAMKLGPSWFAAEVH